MIVAERATGAAATTRKPTQNLSATCSRSPEFKRVAKVRHGSGAVSPRVSGGIHRREFVTHQPPLPAPREPRNIQPAGRWGAEVAGPLRNCSANGCSAQLAGAPSVDRAVETALRQAWFEPSRLPSIFGTRRARRMDPSAISTTGSASSTCRCRGSRAGRSACRRRRCTSRLARLRRPRTRAAGRRARSAEPAQARLPTRAPAHAHATRSRTG